jgi:hypothetical protein
MATLRTVEEQNLLLDLLTKSDQNLFGKENKKNVWIGGVRKSDGKIGDWYWAETGQAVSYTFNWFESRQNDDQDQACLGLYSEVNYTKWSVRNSRCSDNGIKYTYICEK